MRTPYRDGVIDVHLSKPETAAVVKARELLESLSRMQPIRKEISDAAAAAEAGLAQVLKLTACDAEEFMPLVDGVPKSNKPAITDTVVAPPPAPTTPATSAAPAVGGDKKKLTASAK